LEHEGSNKIFLEGLKQKGDQDLEDLRKLLEELKKTVSNLEKAKRY
jgi:hypothetical protein